MERITVFTPTYNRKDLLKRAYKSLIEQTCKDFVWLIIDDGSVDDTKNEVLEWSKYDNGFPIQYIWKENGGLHTAYNTAINAISTELCVCLDSDDWLPKDSIEKIVNIWNKRKFNNVAGIIGLDSYPDGKIIGDKFSDTELTNSIDMICKKGKIVHGDKTNVIRTDLYKRVAPMKVYKGEKNFNPFYMQLQISKKYNFISTNEILKYVEYQPSGMSSNIYKQYFNSPNSFADTRILYLSFSQASILFKIKNTIHLISSCILAGKTRNPVKESKNKVLTIILYPAGILLSCYIKYKNRKN